MTTDLTVLWHTNRRWRAWMDANTRFVTPDTLDCLRYALVESCEALDSWMRARLPDHARNNGRDHTIESELADTAMLLLTAIPERWLTSRWHHRQWSGDNSIDQICIKIAGTIDRCNDMDSWEADIRTALRMIAAYPGIDLAAELDRCWRRLAMKHGGMKVVLHLTSLGLTADEWDELTKDHTWPTPWEESA